MSEYIWCASGNYGKCAGIPRSTKFTQFACFDLKKHDGKQPIWMREFGCYCDACKQFLWEKCKYEDIVGPWILAWVTQEYICKTLTVSRVEYKNHINKRIALYLAGDPKVQHVLLIVYGSQDEEWR